MLTDIGPHNAATLRINKPGREIMADRLGDGPIEPAYIEKMNRFAELLDELFNGPAKGEARETGFVLLVFPLGDHEGRCNYISNANRDDVVVMLKEQIKRFEGQPEIRGHA
jgi:hypothetical protein